MIEDNPGDARLIREYLLAPYAQQFAVQHADRLSAGLTLLATGKVDVVLLDLSLPDSSGLDTFLRVRDQAPSVPIVILTGLEDEEVCNRAIQEGAQDYLPKGQIDPQLLRRALSYAIGRKQAETDRARLLEEVKAYNERLVEASLRERELAEVANRQATELSITIASMADGVMIYSRDGKITRTNRAADEMFGYTLQQRQLAPAERLALLQVKKADGQPIAPADNPVERALSGETVTGFVLVLRRPDGQTVWCSCSASPIRTPDGELLGAVAIFSDITETHDLQEQREDFLRMVSHDLRSPLTSVQGQAQLLLRELQAAGQEGRLRQSAEAIYTGARRMNAMIQDLVDMARVESKQLSLNPVRVDLYGFIQDVQRRLIGVMDAERILVEIPEGLPAAWADPDRLERVLTNILSNALKYSEAEVRVSAGESDGRIAVSVQDRGVGIPEADCAHIFERYYRAQGTRKAEGLGLGLYITRMLVEAMGGRIWVESELGIGSTFTFTLPEAR